VADGDFRRHRGFGPFTQDGDFVDITYDWRIAVNKRLLQIGTPVFRPIFRRQPSLGDGARRREPGARAAPPAGQK